MGSDTGMHNKFLLIIAHCYESIPLSLLSIASTRRPSLGSWVGQLRVLRPERHRRPVVWVSALITTLRHRVRRKARVAEVCIAALREPAAIPPGELKSLQISTEAVTAEPETGRGPVRVGFTSPDTPASPCLPPGASGQSQGWWVSAKQ